MHDPVTAGGALLFLLGVATGLSPQILHVAASWWRTTGPWARRARESREQQAFLRRMAQGRD